MKRHISIRSLGAALLLGCTFGGVPGAFAADQNQKGWGAQFLENMKKWEGKMSDAFRNSFKGAEGGEKSAYSASVDVREQSDHYTVRVRLPDRDLSKVKVTMDGHALKIAGEGGYEQSIALRHAAAVAKPDVQHRDDTLVITVPKGAGATASTPDKNHASPFAESTQTERDVLDRMDKMSREMDRIFEDAFKSFRLGVGGITYFDQAQFGSQLDLQDEKDRYVVRAYLPGRNVQNIDVRVDGQNLRIAAKAEERERKSAGTGGIESFALSSYSQSLTLPGPVRGDKAEVERKENLLVISIPKAEAR